jgi:hypothetical protein
MCVYEKARKGKENDNGRNQSFKKIDNRTTTGKRQQASWF